MVLNPGNIGTINASGIYTAPPVFTTPQTVIVTATSTLDGVTSATATVNFIGRPVATPAFSPPAGTYTSTQSVTISTTTSGASIRYTADGSTPSSTVGTLYSSPVSISTSTTLKAVGYETGMSDSLVVSGLYGIVPPIVRPIF